MPEIPELTEEQFARAISSRLRHRLMRGEVQSGADISALRSFVAMSESEFARALGISIEMLRAWEQNLGCPEGPALALVRIAARHPKIIRENLESAA